MASGFVRTEKVSREVSRERTWNIMSNYSSCAKWALLTGLVLATLAAMTASGQRPAQPSAPGGSLTPRQRLDMLRARAPLNDAAMQDINAGRTAQASLYFQGVLANPLLPTDAVNAHRMLARIDRAERDIQDARAHLGSALACLDGDAALEQAQPLLRGGIILDKADLEADFGNKSAAISFYDQAISLGEDRLGAFEYRIAQSNAASYCYMVGRTNEAIQRLDALLQSPSAAQIPIASIIDYRFERASWRLSSGNYQAAIPEFEAFYNEFVGENRVSVAMAAVIVAQYQSDCAAKLLWCNRALSKVQEVRLHPSGSQPLDIVDLHRLDGAEQEAYVVWTSAEACDPQGAAAARSHIPERLRGSH